MNIKNLYLKKKTIIGYIYFLELKHLSLVLIKIKENSM